MTPEPPGPLPLKGAPGSRREVLALAWPIGVSMLSFSLKGFVDMAMVGQLGTDALGAVGIASIAAWCAITFPWGVLRGQRPLVSQYLGAGDRPLAFSFGVHAAYLAVACGVLLMVFAGEIAGLMGRAVATTQLDEEGVAIAAGYFEIRMLWALPTLIIFAVSEYLRSVGRTRVPMAVDLITHPLNVLCNWILIFGHFGAPALGARGAALGTGIAELLGMLVLFWLARPAARIPRRAFRVRLARLREVVIVGLTGGVQFSLENFSFLTVTYFIAYAGPLALAVHQAGIELVHLSLLPAVAIGDAGSVLIGRYVGQMKWDEVRRTLRSTLQILLPFMACMGAIFLVWGRELTAIFLHHDDPAVLDQALTLGAGVMAAAALWQLGDALQVAFRFALRATGDHRWVMVTGILCSWLLSAPLAALVVFVFDGDVADVWLVWGLEIFVGSGIFIWRWRSGAWVRKRLVRENLRSEGREHTVHPCTSQDPREP